ncbi:unnamed protein product [Tetraodon nigroviridis]|uniref:ATP-dependent RNA helicase n=1 Tax=Tetraodon nigroviridis TaxID=99883 RepID=Q4SWK6_TETNG|nr:unnamed protein product [Tetraodon nigroviridis]
MKQRGEKRRLTPTEEASSSKRSRLQHGGEELPAAQAPQKKKATEKSGPKTSSLFRNNPEIPQVHRATVSQVEEEIFTSDTFTQMSLHPHLVTTLNNVFNVSTVTSVQRQTIPVLLSGRDALVRSQTGSGKTLSYAIPVVQSLQALQPKVSRGDGPLALILVPTRELAQQTFVTFQKLLKPFTWVVPGVLMGGEKRKAEKARLRKGINILVSTPGRLVDHIRNTLSISFSAVRWLVLDEADRTLDLGFEKDLSVILNSVNSAASSRQNVLLVSPLSHRRLCSSLWWWFPAKSDWCVWLLSSWANASFLRTTKSSSSSPAARRPSSSTCCSPPSSGGPRPIRTLESASCVSMATCSRRQERGSGADRCVPALRCVRLRSPAVHGQSGRRQQPRPTPLAANRCSPCVSGCSGSRSGPAAGHLDPAVHAPHDGRRVRAPRRADGASGPGGQQPHLPHASRDGLRGGTGQSQHQPIRNQAAGHPLQLDDGRHLQGAGQVPQQEPRHTFQSAVGGARRQWLGAGQSHPRWCRPAAPAQLLLGPASAVLVGQQVRQRGRGPGGHRRQPPSAEPPPAGEPPSPPAPQSKRSLGRRPGCLGFGAVALLNDHAHLGPHVFTSSPALAGGGAPALAESHGRAVAGSGLRACRRQPVHGRGPAGHPEQRQPEEQRHQLLVGLAAPVLLLLVRTLYPVLQHVEGPGRGRQRLAGCDRRLGVGLRSGREPRDLPGVWDPAVPNNQGRPSRRRPSRRRPRRRRSAAVTLPSASGQFFHAHSPETDRGTPFRGANRQVQTVRQVMVDILQNHTKLDWPDRCPRLEPYRYPAAFFSLNIHPSSRNPEEILVFSTQRLFRPQLRGPAPPVRSEVRGLHRHRGGGARLLRGTRGELSAADGGAAGLIRIFSGSGDPGPADVLRRAGEESAELGAPPGGGSWALQSFLRAYTTYPARLKHIFHIRSLHLGHTAKSFALREAPQALGAARLPPGGGAKSRKRRSQNRPESQVTPPGPRSVMERVCVCCISASSLLITTHTHTHTHSCL